MDSSPQLKLITVLKPQAWVFGCKFLVFFKTQLFSCCMCLQMWYTSLLLSKVQASYFKVYSKNEVIYNFRYSEKKIYLSPQADSSLMLHISLRFSCGKKT